MTGFKSKKITSSDLTSIHLVPTIIVFLVMILLIGISWRTATQTVIDTQKEQVDVRSEYVELNVRQRIDNLNLIVRGGAGLFEGSSSVSRDEWKRYYNSLELEKKFPALFGLGFAQMVTNDERKDFEQTIKGEGFENFVINPVDTPRPLYFPITYIEPLTDRNIQVLGGDLYNEEVRRNAMLTAQNDDTTSMTDAVIMLQENNVRSNGITLFHPVYNKDLPISNESERQAAILGFIYAPVKSNELFGDIFTDNDTAFNFIVYDGPEFNEKTLLFERYPGNTGEPYVQVKKTNLNVNNQSWTIIYSVRGEIVSSAIRERPRSIVVGGVILAFLVAGLVFLLLEGRSRRIAENENQKLESAKDSMLSLASHQLRTPATGVKQYIGMVLEGFAGNISKEQKKLLQKANDSNERQLRIINEFLYLAKADAERIVVTPQQFNLIELTKDVVSGMQSEILQAGHKISIKHSTKKVLVYADQYTTRMILENLISNAAKYTPPGGNIKVAVRSERATSSVSVEDNGVGISKSDIKKLFQQFSRIPNELSHQESGSGIGLYLSKYLAELNNCKISVITKKHKGSTFTLTLPNKTVKNITVRSKKET